MPSTSEIANAVIVSNKGAGQPIHDQFGDRHLLAKRKAEIEADDALDVEEQLLRQRPVETEFLAQLGHENLVAGAGLAVHDDGRIAGSKPDQEEVQDDDRKQNDRALDDPLGNE